MSRSIAVLLLIVQLGSIASCDEADWRIADFSDEAIVRISDYQDRRTSDSLYEFLAHEDVRYRWHAAMAFASIQDTAAAQHLRALLLNDEDVAVRQAAAYALGQTGGTKATSLLLQAMREEQDSDVLAIILEAIGKTAGANEVPDTNFHNPGMPWMYYRLGLRHETPPRINPIVAQYLSQDNEPSSRLGAAHFFARSKTTTIDDALTALTDALRNDPDPEVRMASAWALRKIVSEQSRDVLSHAALNDKDYRVRVNAVNALETFPFSETRATLLRALQDSFPQVGVAAAGTIGKVAEEGDIEEILDTARNAKHWRVQAELFQAVNVGDRNLNAEITALYNAASNPYQKAALLIALNGRDALTFVSNVLFTTEIPAIRTAAAQVIVALNREVAQNVNDRKTFLDLYSRGIALGDLAVTGLFTNALADSTLGFRDVVTDLSFLYEARDKFSLPRDYESYLPLEQAIAFFERRDPHEIDKPFNHPIDWDLVRKIPSGQQAVISTTRGEIVIDLHVATAPGSVANFVRLVLDGYYNRKSFHRVVPNFVVQGGCDRGDGWGSAEYSIRSEFSMLRRYATGSVGLASAGKDTESTQFFITHSPTPHLDGRYTIFGSVSKGMENAHRLEVGDSILTITLMPPLNPG